MASESGRRGLYLRLAALALLAVGGIALVKFTPVGELFDGPRMIELFESIGRQWWAPILLVLIFMVSAMFGLPATPPLLVGGVVFGFALGTLYNITGLMAGALVSYYVGRALGRDAVLKLGGPRLRRAEKVFQRRGFLPLVQSRFLPIPFAIVGYASALAGVSVFTFALTSFLGLFPATLLHTWFGPEIVRRTLEGQPTLGLVVTYFGGLGVLNLLILGPQIRRAFIRRRRYRELMEARRARTS
ncbi:MAG: VTT domain-containing protein [Acidobacteriota bacterium]